MYWLLYAQKQREWGRGGNTYTLNAGLLGNFDNHNLMAIPTKM